MRGVSDAGADGLQDNGAPPNPAGVTHTRTPEGRAPGYIARNHPFRGHKALVWEGGVRVPGFVHSPLLPAGVRGTESHSLYHVTDWLPTIVGAAGGSTSGNLALDGHDIWQSLASAIDLEASKTEEPLAMHTGCFIPV